MNALARCVVERALLVWCVILAVSILLGGMVSERLRDQLELERVSLLQTEAERRSLELMSLTLNGNLMGAVAVLGLIDPNIKQEALGKSLPNSPKVLPTLESIARSYDADGVFVVAESGIVASSWDNSGKPSTGLNIKFRPYYQMAMQGMDNVYAAVSIARGDRSLYFSAPVYAEVTSGTTAIGAVVARTSTLKLDNLLRDTSDLAMLLSPQGVVYASNRKEWIGHLSGQPAPERLKAIRELKQFGNMFESKEPQVLPLAVAPGRHVLDGKRYAVATAKVQWNDPFGEWTLVLAEELEKSVPAHRRLQIGAGIAFALMLMGTLLFNMLKSHHRQVLASGELATYARQQEASAVRKSGIAQATVRLQRAASVDNLAQIYLEEAHRLFAVLQGVVYVRTEETMERYRLAGSYACAAAPPAMLESGEGLLGQCAVERRSRVIRSAPDDLATIRSGLGATPPTTVLLLPVMMNENVLGIVELAMLHVPDEAENDTIEELTALLAMNIEIIKRSERTDAALSAARTAEQSGSQQLVFQQTLLDTIPYPVFYKDAAARFLGFNRAYEAAFGVSRGDLIGKSVLDLDYLPEADRIAYRTEDEAVIAGLGKIEREVRMVYADGQAHDTLYYVSGFAGPDGRPAGLIGTFIDITPLKSAPVPTAPCPTAKELQA